MPANIQVILQQDVDKLGKSGELVRVRPGFARNFLLPRELAVPAPAAAVNRIEHEKTVALAKAEKGKKEARDFAAKIDALAVHMQKINAERSRIRGKHVSHTGTLAEGLLGFQGRLAGIWGEFDATAVPYLAERGEKLRQFQPQASFEIFEGAGHWVQYEAAERFNRRLRELVTS